MQRYAQLSGDIVSNVIESETDPDGVNGEWIACGEAAPGWRYADGVFIPSPPAEPEWAWYIDIGTFFDRFGAAKMAVLTSTDPGVQAILADTQVRKWIDLKRADVAQSVAYIGTVVTAVTPALQASILTTPVSPEENLALRKQFFA